MNGITTYRRSRICFRIITSRRPSVYQLQLAQPVKTNIGAIFISNRGIDMTEAVVVGGDGMQVLFHRLAVIYRI